MCVSHWDTSVECTHHLQQNLYSIQFHWMQFVEWCRPNNAGIGWSIFMSEKWLPMKRCDIINIVCREKWWKHLATIKLIGRRVDCSTVRSAGRQLSLPGKEKSRHMYLIPVSLYHSIASMPTMSTSTVTRTRIQRYTKFVLPFCTFIVGTEPLKRWLRFCCAGIYRAEFDETKQKICEAFWLVFVWSIE